MKYNKINNNLITVNYFLINIDVRQYECIVFEYLYT